MTTLEGLAQDAWMLLSGFGRMPESGLSLNIALTLTAIPAALLLGVVVGVLRIRFGGPLRWLLVGYTEFAKSIPLILGVFWFHYVVPVVYGKPLPLFVSATMALVFFGSAAFAEVVRGGWSVLRRNELDCAQLAGLSPRTVWGRIILPRIGYATVPAMLSVSVSMFKDTSVVFVIGLIELTQTGTILANRLPDKFVVIYLITGAAYFVVCSSLSALAVRCNAMARRRGLVERL